LERVIPGALNLLRETKPDKSRRQGRELVAKVVAEMRRTPPRLYLFAMAASAVIIALIAGTIALHNYVEDRAEAGPQRAVRQIAATAPDSSGTAAASTPPASVPAAPAEVSPPAQSPPQSQAPQVAAAPTGEQARAVQTPAETPAGNQQQTTRPSPRARAETRKSKARQSVPAVELAVDSNPPGAEILFDGSSLCQSPCKLKGIAPGQHMITASKPGFVSVTRNLTLTATAGESVSLELNRLVASLSVASTPAGAVIRIDGKDTGKLTPSEFNFDSAGAHTITLERYQYLEESSSVTVELGQKATVNLTLKHLGMTEEIRPAAGRLKKVLGHEDTTGMAIVSVKTQPKGAQILVNKRALDKTSPFDFYLNPGTYVIDITMAGYRDLHRVIVLQEGEKLLIQESLLPE
ncbi:MAG: PEGA domain-containing protein, partial [Acidobacteria bacterium]|nr:PEGA domain-containing protein [Acidobacteriota bacterium]